MTDKHGNIPFQVINWKEIIRTTSSGKQGEVSAQTKQFGDLRIRIVEYSSGYMADHWCRKGHIIYCLEGQFTSELRTGERFSLSKGMSYVVSDDLSEHRSQTDTGATLLIIDGDFLKLK
jgi:hypothetical protein